MTVKDTFRGDDANLYASIEALLAADAEGILVPHGIGGHARTLLSACYCRLKRYEAAASPDVAVVRNF